MKFKYYAPVPDLEKAIELYANIFDGDIIKPYKEGSYHGLISAFGKVSLLLHGRGDSNHKPGWFIFRFDKNEKQEYLDACERVRNHPLINVDMDNHPGRWGTTFFEFTDPYGYTWDFEIDTEALK